MSKPKNPVAIGLALIFILPFAAGMVHAQPPTLAPKSITGKSAADTPPKEVPPPTLDTNTDGKADAWDRDANGLPDAWDINNDNKPDLFDDNGDGKPDEKKAPPPPVEEPSEPQ